MNPRKKIRLLWTPFSRHTPTVLLLYCEGQSYSRNLVKRYCIFGVIVGRSRMELIAQVGLGYCRVLSRVSVVFIYGYPVMITIFVC